MQLMWVLMNSPNRCKPLNTLIKWFHFKCDGLINKQTSKQISCRITYLPKPQAVPCSVPEKFGIFSRICLLLFPCFCLHILILCCFALIHTHPRNLSVTTMWENTRVACVISNTYMYIYFLHTLALTCRKSIISVHSCLLSFCNLVLEGIAMHVCHMLFTVIALSSVDTTSKLSYLHPWFLGSSWEPAKRCCKDCEMNDILMGTSAPHQYIKTGQLKTLLSFFLLPPNVQVSLSPWLPQICVLSWQKWSPWCTLMLLWLIKLKVWQVVRFFSACHSCKEWLFELL